MSDRVRVSWTEFKALIVRHNAGRRIRYREVRASNPEDYDLWFDEGPTGYKTTVSDEDGSTDLQEFKDDFLLDADRPARTSDGKDIVLINSFPGDTVLYIPGVSDDIAAGTIGDIETAADSLKVCLDLAPGATSEKFVQAIEPYYLAGGHFEWEGGKLGSWVKLQLIFPATPVYTSGALDYEITNGLIHPAAGGPGTGTHRVDLAAKHNANVNFSEVVPVPSADSTGYFNWDQAEEEDGNQSVFGVANPAQPDGAFHLIAAEVAGPLFVPGILMTKQSNSRDLLFSAIKPKKILAHWKLKVRAHNDAANGSNLEFSADLFTSRKNPTP